MLRRALLLACSQVAVCVFAFDCLSLNGRTLLREPLTARREALYSALNESEGHLQFATAKVRRGQGGPRAVPLGTLSSCLAACWGAGWCIVLPAPGPQSHGFLSDPALSALPTVQSISLLFNFRFYLIFDLFRMQTSRDVEELTRFLDESVEAGTEGLIVKTIEGGCMDERCCACHACRGSAAVAPPCCPAVQPGCACACDDMRVTIPPCPALPCPTACLPRRPQTSLPGPRPPPPPCLHPPVACRLVRALQALLSLAEAEEGLPRGGWGRGWFCNWMAGAVLGLIS